VLALVLLRMVILQGLERVVEVEEVLEVLGLKVS
jgi:hypothetical protein